MKKDKTKLSDRILQYLAYELGYCWGLNPKRDKRIVRNLKRIFGKKWREDDQIRKG